MTPELKLSPKYFRFGIIIVLLLLLGFSSLGTVGVGQRGIHVRFSGATGKVFQEGLYFKLPLIDKVILMDVKLQKDQANAQAASKDLQTVDSTIALNFHVDPVKTSQIFQNVGVNYKERIIDPAIQEAVKASTAKFTAEELVTKREEVKDQIKGILAAKLEPRGILVDEFNIVSFNFSKSFNEAIEAKVTAEQNALAAKNKLEQVKFEAEQRVTQAKGEAEAIQIQAQAIQQQGGAAYVNLKAVEKWDGKLPAYMLGNSVPFVNLQQ
ncbi:MAG: prohibitin family protein [Patescibacteria group bacterium]